MKRYNSINDWMKSRFGQRVYKVSLESGCSCPNRDGTVGSTGCSFCNLASYNPATAPDGFGENLPSIRAQLEDGIRYACHRHQIEKVIAYFQSGSNTHAPAEKLRSIFEEAISHPMVTGLAISTRPDCIGDDHLAMFSDLAKRTTLWIELGLQSAHDETLKSMNRGHDSECFAKTCKALHSIGVPVCAHVILGLQGETPDMMIQTARFLNGLKVWGVKIHNLHVLKGTMMEKLYTAGKITLPSLETYAGWVVDFLEALDPAIVIHRVNSHSPRSITVAPEWSINKLAIFNEVEKELGRRETCQGGRFLLGASRGKFMYLRG